jgi:hypothetical protein
MTYLTIMTIDANLETAQVLSETDDFSGAIDALVTMRDTVASLINHDFRAIILDPDHNIVARIAGGDGATASQMLADAWSLNEDALQIDSFAGAVDPDDRRARPVVFTVSTLAVHDEEEIDPVDPVDNGEPQE